MFSYLERDPIRRIGLHNNVQNAARVEGSGWLLRGGGEKEYTIETRLAAIGVGMIIDGDTDNRVSKNVFLLTAEKKNKKSA